MSSLSAARPEGPAPRSGRRQRLVLQRAGAVEVRGAVDVAQADAAVGAQPQAGQAGVHVVEEDAARRRADRGPEQAVGEVAVGDDRDHVVLGGPSGLVHEAGERVAGADGEDVVALVSAAPPARVVDRVRHARARHELVDGAARQPRVGHEALAGRRVADVDAAALVHLDPDLELEAEGRRDGPRGLDRAQHRARDQAVDARAALGEVAGQHVRLLEPQLGQRRVVRARGREGVAVARPERVVGRLGVADQQDVHAQAALARAASAAAWKRRARSISAAVGALALRARRSPGSPAGPAGAGWASSTPMSGPSSPSRCWRGGRGSSRAARRASLTCRQRRRSRPISRSMSLDEGVARRRAGGCRRPRRRRGRCRCRRRRAGRPTASITAASSPMSRPMVSPAPAEFSSSSQASSPSTSSAQRRCPSRSAASWRRGPCRLCEPTWKTDAGEAEPARRCAPCSRSVSTALVVDLGRPVARLMK